MRFLILNEGAVTLLFECDVIGLIKTSMIAVCANDRVLGF